MGQVKTVELANSNAGVEITYGGADAAFGGVDSSAPPAYIDPRCFVLGSGCIIANNKLCAASTETLATPTLWTGVSGVQLIGFGTFYNSIFGQLNYALGYTATPIVGPPSGVSYKFYMTSWDAGNIAIVHDDTLVVGLYDSYTPANAASLTLPCLASSSVSASAGHGATGSITSVFSGNGTILAATLTGGVGYGVGDAVQIVPDAGYIPPDYGWLIVTGVGGGGAITTTMLATNTGLGYSTGTIHGGVVETTSTVKLQIVSTSGTNNYTANAYGGAVTPASIVSQLVSAINGNPDVSAAPSADGFSIVITALVPGAAGNSFTVQDLSTAASVGQPPPFYFPALSPDHLLGGTDATGVTALRSLASVSTTSVGGTLYIANLGPLILKYSGPTTFAVSSMYEGVNVLRKFAGSLIGAGVIPQLGFQVQDQDMIFAWTAANKLDEWSPINSAGNRTGAGFEQLSDIGEFLSGLIVSNGTCYILRKQGVSYATATGNALVPFAVNHIGLGEQGEGTQVPSLVTQYDSVGCYVGNTNIWQITGQISPIGDKIKSMIFTALNNTLPSPVPANQISAGSGAVFIGGDEYPIAAFVIGGVIFLFNTSNGTWTTLTLTTDRTHITQMLCVPLATKNVEISTGTYGQTVVALIMQQTISGVLQPPAVFAITENLADTNSNTAAFSVIFPEEELSFGRDVTIDSLYMAIQAQLSANITMNVYINNILYATRVFQPTDFSVVGVTGNPVEFQIFPASTGVNTGHSPQLRIDLVNSAGVQSSKIRFNKITMFGSIDAKQRPV